MVMKRRFNVTGSCIPERHYMVRLEERLRKIKEEFVDTGSYFVINRGRQYGKTTTLDALKTYLQEDYIVLSLDFQQIATEDFADAQSFVRAFAEVLMETLEISGFGGIKELTGPLEELLQKARTASRICSQV